MTAERIRVEVDDFAAGRGVVLYLTPPRLDAQQDEWVKAVIEEAVDTLAATTGQPRRWVREALLCELVLRMADGDAYVREAGRRGVLAL